MVRKPNISWGRCYIQICKKYGALARDWAWRYSKVLKSDLWTDDIYQGIILGMTKIYIKYYFMGKPQGQLTKLVKTVPRNYWASYLKKKDFEPKASVADLQIPQEEKIDMLYDQIYMNYEEKRVS